MSLVAYASSDDSEKENEISTEVTLPKKRGPVKISIPSLKEFQEKKPDPIVEPKPKFMKLKGKEMKNINIIDVSPNNQYNMQSITEEYRPLKQRHDRPTSQQKRKHQITYLAYQAKERELDLKNQWAHNKRTRRETQAKYGF